MHIYGWLSICILEWIQTKFPSNGRERVIFTSSSFLLPAPDLLLMLFLRVPCPPAAFLRAQWAVAGSRWQEVSIPLTEMPCRSGKFTGSLDSTLYPNVCP